MLISSGAHTTRSLKIGDFKHLQNVLRGYSLSTIRLQASTNDNGANTQSRSSSLQEKQAALAQSEKRSLSALKAWATRLERKQLMQDAKTLPPRAAPSAFNPHHDLASFLDYAEHFELKTSTTVFKGTLYEYTVAEALQMYNLSLRRVGKADDRGIDLIGDWPLPESKMRVLVQCKMTKTMPSLIRELEGSYAGAPAGWDGDNVLAILVCRHVATPGTQQAMQRSRYPLGFVQMDLDGTVKQFIWNQVANDCGLAGLGATSKFSVDTDRKDVSSSIALVWNGKPWPLD